LIEVRHRAGLLLVAVVLAQIILISAQVNTQRGVSLLEAVAFGVFSEVQRTIAGGVAAVRGAWTGYVALRGVVRENEALRRRLAQAEVELQQQRALADRSRGLARLLELREQAELTTVAAAIVGAGATPDFQTVTIDKGTADGVKRDMAVIAPAGVVGRVVTTGARAAKVQLLIDRNAAAGAIVERSRAQGVVVGAGDDRLHMEQYVSESADIAVGDVVMSSGIDGIYPKGFLIGRVESVQKSGTAYKRILVKPAVDFRSLEEVLVVIAPAGAREAAGSVE